MSAPAARPRCRRAAALGAAAAVLLAACGTAATEQAPTGAGAADGSTAPTDEAADATAPPGPSVATTALREALVGSAPVRYDASAARVVGLGDPEDPVAVRTEELLGRGVVELEVADEAVVVLAAPGQASALDTREIAEGADVGTTGAFSAALDGRVLSLRPGDAPGEFVDDVTGSTWDVQGVAVAGPESGRELQRLPSTDTFWFSWQSFWPGTALVP
ncbi:DUF3179 domain-containing (seleno)protein [Aquipuribacter sp. MA13-6]|uniref:DUF3179 domain-containing (seleno)protein n=1 Tax=unclassified Aquipuribacter TaxID=2635084 RepID=UPI003EE8E318